MCDEPPIGWNERSEAAGLMNPSLEVMAPEGRFALELAGPDVTIGSRDDNGLVLAWDRRVSRVHAVVERAGQAWCVRDLASTNGTWVNGERIWAARPLRHGDELIIGRTRLVFHATPVPEAVTEGSLPLPPLTPRERDVLLALCEPVLRGDLFTEPASTKELARKLVVSEAAVKLHLVKLYDKFGLRDPSERRRVKLANEAISRGAVSLGDLRRADGS